MIKNKTVKIKQVTHQRLEVRYNIEKLDDWVIKQVYPLQWSKIDPIIESHHCFRAIHCLKNKFVFFARFDGVFCKFEKPLDYDAYVEAPNPTIYVGECLAIDDVIKYIAENRDLAF